MGLASTQAEKKSCGQKFSDGCSNFGAFLYDKQTGKVMGREGGSWAKIGLFYVLLYSFLAGYFSIMMFVFLTTVNPSEKIGLKDAGPKLTQYLVGSPGLTLVNELPTPFDKTKGVDEFVAATDKYLLGYNQSSSIGKCPTDSATGYEGDEACQFDTSLLGPCAGAAAGNADYGYSSAQPCVFIKMNKIWGWVPDSDGGKVFLKLACTGEVDVYPEGGYLKSAFPYLGQKGFQNPPVAVRVKDASKKQLIQCKLQGKGIKIAGSYNPQRAFGQIEFEIEPSKKEE